MIAMDRQCTGAREERAGRRAQQAGTPGEDVTAPAVGYLSFG